MPLSPKTVCDNLDHIQEVDLVEGATYREQAYTVLADDAVSTNVKEEVCEHLNRANQLQALTTVSPDERY